MSAASVEERALDQALDRWMPGARRVGPWIWRLPLGDAWLPGARMTREERWLSCELPLDAAPDDLWTLLRANGRLPGRAKTALGADGAPVLRADAPLEVDVDLSCVCRDLIAELSIARLALAEAISSPGPTEGEAATDHAPLTALEALCVETGWSSSVRDSGAVVVELGVPGAFHQAEITRLREGARVAVTVVPRAPLAPESHRALAELLLRASRLVRLARAAAEEGEGGDRVWFEVCFERAPDAAALDHALSSLSIACRTCAREADLLVDPSVARVYLELRAPPSATTSASSSRSEPVPEPEVQHEAVR